ncbi:hypothetical protein RYX36_013951 [Vicia faba]
MKKRHFIYVFNFEWELLTLELQLDLAESLLNQISDCLYPHPYNALLASCDALVSSIMKLQSKACFLLLYLKNQNSYI